IHSNTQYLFNFSTKIQIRRNKIIFSQEKMLNLRDFQMFQENNNLILHLDEHYYEESPIA
ncbi:MAG: hypothetical protein SOW56_01740, partial [Bacteroidaceae bacterium]|nr:hypothetical protein [Bacteroidaceae bacterium]